MHFSTTTGCLPCGMPNPLRATPRIKGLDDDNDDEKSWENIIAMWSAPTLAIWLGIVHYLDKGVSGLLVVATIQQPKKSGTTSPKEK